MSTVTRPPAQAEVIYPDCDGNPMSENTLQFEWIVTIKGGLDAVFRDDPNVFVAGDLLWYPVEGDNVTRAAPDVMVVFGRPKGHRGSYMQWREGGIPPQVVFEILSPGNRAAEMAQKFEFYRRYGVEEYYLFDPDRLELTGWRRAGDLLESIVTMAGWISPRLGVGFDWDGQNLTIIGPNGRPFVTYLELDREREQERQRAEQERRRADEERLRADRLAAQLRALGIEPEL